MVAVVRPGSTAHFGVAKTVYLDVASATEVQAWLPVLKDLHAVVNCVGALQNSSREDVVGRAIAARNMPPESSCGNAFSKPWPTRPITPSRQLQPQFVRLGSAGLLAASSRSSAAILLRPWRERIWFAVACCGSMSWRSSTA